MIRPVERIANYTPPEQEEIVEQAPSTHEIEKEEAPHPKRPSRMFGFVCDQTGRCICQAV